MATTTDGGEPRYLIFQYHPSQGRQFQQCTSSMASVAASSPKISPASSHLDVMAQRSRRPMPRYSGHWTTGSAHLPPPSSMPHRSLHPGHMARYESISTDTSYFGAKIWITSEGKVWLRCQQPLSANVQEGPAGASPADAERQLHLLDPPRERYLSWATAKIQFVGVNDAAVPHWHQHCYFLSEGIPLQSTGGKLNATDVDSFPPPSHKPTWPAATATAVHHRRGWHLTYVMKPTHTTSLSEARTTPIPHCRHRRRHHPGVDWMTMHGTNDAGRHHRLQHRRADRNQRCPEHRRRSQRHRCRQPRHLHATNQRDWCNGYGKFTPSLRWYLTYVMDNAHDEFVGGQDHTDSPLSPPQTVTTQVLTGDHAWHTTMPLSSPAPAPPSWTETNAAQEHRRRSQRHHQSTAPPPSCHKPT